MVTVKDLTAAMSELMGNILQVRYTNLEAERLSCGELLKLAEKSGSTYAKAFAYTYLGDYYLSQSDAEKSGQYLQWARELCAEHAYEALNMKACHLSGFFYHIIYDEQNALQYYLEALNLAQRFNDIQQICNTWNNIADMFQSHGAYEEAKQYYLHAYEMMVSHDCTDKRLLLMILHNLAEVTGISGDGDGMEQYLLAGENVEGKNPSEESLNNLNMLSARCIQAAIRGERAHAIKIAECILDMELHKLEDRYFVMELLLPVGQALLNLGEAKFSKLYIDILTEYSSLNETNFAQRLLRLRTLHAETFSDVEACNASYKEYYHKMQSIIEVENRVRVDGMKVKIYLQEVIRKQETTQQENKRLEDAVNLDALTGIYNRRYFDQCMNDAAKSPLTQPFGVIMLDIDYFKEFNDNYGHLRGDCVLREIGFHIKEHSSPAIQPCRYGGDEFACVCYGCTDEEIESYITKLCDNIEKLSLTHEYSGCAKRITLSIGYSNSDGRRETVPNKILAEADRALYRAKSKGRNCWHRENNDQ